MHEQLTRLITEATQPKDRNALTAIYNAARQFERAGSVDSATMANTLFIVLASWFGKEGELFALQDAMTEFIKKRMSDEG